MIFPEYLFINKTNLDWKYCWYQQWLHRCIRGREFRHPEHLLCRVSNLPGPGYSLQLQPRCRRNNPHNYLEWREKVGRMHIRKGKETQCAHKVKIFWEGHKIRKKISSTLTSLSSVKSKWKSFLICVVFSEYLNFNKYSQRNLSYCVLSIADCYS